MLLYMSTILVKTPPSTKHHQLSAEKQIKMNVCQHAHLRFKQCSQGNWKRKKNQKRQIIPDFTFLGLHVKCLSSQQQNCKKQMEPKWIICCWDAQRRVQQKLNTLREKKTSRSNIQARRGRMMIWACLATCHSIYRPNISTRNSRTAPDWYTSKKIF